MGIVPLLASAMYGASVQSEAEKNRVRHPFNHLFLFLLTGTSFTQLRMELYGPSGLRKLLRTTLQITHATLAGKYAVHELLRPGDAPLPCVDTEMHANETAGRDIWCGSDGRWRGLETSEGIVVDAAPIVHRGTPSPFFYSLPNSMTYLFGETQCHALDTCSPSYLAPNLYPKHLTSILSNEIARPSSRKVSPTPDLSSVRSSNSENPSPFQTGTSSTPHRSPSPGARSLFSATPPIHRACESWPWMRVYSFTRLRMRTCRSWGRRRKRGMRRGKGCG